MRLTHQAMLFSRRQIEQIERDRFMKFHFPYSTPGHFRNGVPSFRHRSAIRRIEPPLMKEGIAA